MSGIPGDFDSPRVSMFENAFAQAPHDADLSAILDTIRHGLYAAPVANLRKLRASDPEKYKTEKRNLPAFCVSGTAQDRKTPLVHSGLLQIDCDKLNGTLEGLRERLKADVHVEFGFVSPSGDGLKLGLRIDGERHAESFAAAQCYFRETYGVEIDPAVKDRLRLCFVSHDPNLWTREDAEPLPIPDEPEPAADTFTTGQLAGIVLPSGAVSFSESARAIFQRLAPTHSLFWRGGALVELSDVGGVASLEIVKPDGFRSRVERLGNVFAWRQDDGKPVLKPARMSRDDAGAIMATLEAKELLPPIASVLRCGVMVENADGSPLVLGRGYHQENGGTLIVEGEIPQQVPIGEAVKSLRWLVEEVDFQSPGDEARALAAFITPALRMGGHLKGPLPIDVAEADQSQAGKGYRHNQVCALYGEASYFVTARNGGVGSTDESFASALIAGRPFVCLDNFRGRLDSQTLESFITAPGLFAARVPHRGEVLIDPRRFCLQMSSNGMEATRDLANRSSICRIRKRPGFAYRDTLGELKARQSYFLGCVFAVVAEWIAGGKPRTKDCRHDFREWCQILDWICREILGTAPLMDGHEAAQERVSNPALSWLRAVALALEGEGRMGETLIASEMSELCGLHGLEIPGKPVSEDESKKQIGRLCARVFKGTDCVEIDGFTVTRKIEYVSRPDGEGRMESKVYHFTKA